MRKLLLLFCFGLLTALGWAEPGYGNITATSSTCGTNNSSNSTACVVLPIRQTSGSVAISIIGTWAATLQFEVSADNGASWVSISGFPPNSTTGASSTTANGTWQLSASAYTYIRVRCSAFTSGTAVITMQQAQPSASSGHGGGSGTITGSGTTGYLTAWSGATAIGNSLCDEGITTANFLTCGDTSGIAAAGFTGTGSTAGYMALINGSTNSIPANSLRIQAPATITTGFGWTLPSAENASAGFLKIGAASSHESTLTIAALTQAEIPAPLLTLGTSRSIANGAEIVVCTTTCTVTPIIPTSPFGQEFCVFNGDNVSTVITLAALTGVQYEVTARTSYGTANHTKTSGGAVKDMICMVAIDATHYIATNFIGTWTDN